MTFTIYFDMVDIMKTSHRKKTLQAVSQKTKECYLFWEITSKCDNNCKFCFRRDGTTHKDISYEDCLKILASYLEFIKRYNIVGNVTFSGGDPLLREDFFDILKIAGEYQASGALNKIRILSNPAYLNQKTVKKIKSTADITYKLSIDGLEKNHDFIRKPGSFKQTIKALKLLKKENIQTTVAFTFCRINADDLLDVIRLMLDNNVDAFAFATVTPIGGGEDFKDRMLTPAQYRKLLLDALSLLDSLPKKHLSFVESILRSELLFGRIFYELGRWDEYKQLMEFGKTHGKDNTEKGLVFAVLPDGIVYPRRLIKIKIGQVPKDSFSEIYQRSDLIRSFEDKEYTERKRKEFKKCRQCLASDYCGRQTAAINHIEESLYGPHVMCWVK